MQNMNTFASDAVNRNNTWKCLVCGNEFLAKDLEWYDGQSPIPQCPCCYTDDMLIEKKD